MVQLSPRHLSTTTWHQRSGPQQQALEHGQATYDIVVVDDEAPIARVIAEALSDEGYRVGIFHDGASALLAISQHPPRLVLLDNAMPVMTGAELLKALRRSGYHDLPIILMSAGSRLAEFLDQGATDIIPKPFELDELIACVEAYTRADNNQ